MFKQFLNWLRRKWYGSPKPLPNINIRSINGVIVLDRGHGSEYVVLRGNRRMRAMDEILKS